MATSNYITIVGNLTADPELRYTQNGIPVVNFTVAETPRFFDRQSNEWKDGEASFFRATAWRTHAEHIAASFSKGQRVIVTGTIRQRNYQDREGNARSTFEIEVDEIGPSVKYGVATFTRSASNGSRGQDAQGESWSPQGQQAPAGATQPQGDQWAPAQPQQQEQAPAMAGTAQPQGDAWGGGAFGDDTPF